MCSNFKNYTNIPQNSIFVLLNKLTNNIVIYSFAKIKLPGGLLKIILYDKDKERAHTIFFKGFLFTCNNRIKNILKP